MAVIERDQAELERDMIVEHFDVDPEGDAWAETKDRLIRIIMAGRLTLDGDAIKLTLAAPIELESGQTIAAMTFKEPTAGGIRSMDKYKADEKMAKTIALAAHMTGQPMAVIDKMGARDITAMGAITALFF
jgi:hypothetical protein